jgi:mannitol/fructose-specific phosphotransferase system IIA component (Ntr-type)
VVVARRVGRASPGGAQDFTHKLVSVREVITVPSHVESPTELIAQPDVVMLDLAASSREAALRALHGRLSAAAGVNDPDRFLLDLLERAMVAPVCIAPDVALPHARTNSVDRIVLGVARLAAPGVGFDGEHPGVRLMFMIGTPRQQVVEYLQLVAAISRVLKTSGAREALLAAPTEAEFRAVLARAGAS